MQCQSKLVCQTTHNDHDSNVFNKTYYSRDGMRRDMLMRRCLGRDPETRQFLADLSFPLHFLELRRF
jgi:hypothetical protein